MTQTRRLILHIGGPKCGSSAIQLSLSRQPEFTSRGGVRYSFATLDRKGNLFTGEELKALAKVSSSGARSAPNVPTAADVESVLRPAVPALTALMDKGIVPILSSEGWANCAERFAETRILEALGGGAEVVLYVRPPVDWLNSGWWQWGVWTGSTLDAYVQRNLKVLNWAAIARQWSEVPGVAKLHVALATDVTTRFYDLLDTDAPPAVLSNAGVPASFLLFLLRNRKYREGPHDPRTEFIVARHLPQQRYPTPWALEPRHVAMAMERLAPMAEKLARRLSPEDRDTLMADPRWRDPAAYADRLPEDLAQHETPEALARLIGLLAEGLGRNGGAAQRAALAKLSAAPADRRLAMADAEIAAAVDEMLGSHKGQARKAKLVLAKGFLGRFLR